MHFRLSIVARGSQSWTLYSGIGQETVRRTIKEELWYILDWILASSGKTAADRKLFDKIQATLGRLSIYSYFRAEKSHEDEDEIAHTLKYLDKALARPNLDMWARGIALFGAGLLCRATGDLYIAQIRLKESEEIFRRELELKKVSSDSERISKTQLYLAFVLAFLSLVDRDSPDNSDAIRHIDESLSILKNDLRFSWGEALARTYRGTILLSQIIQAIKNSEKNGNLNKEGSRFVKKVQQAIEELEASERQFREEGDSWGINQTLIYLGICTYQIARCEEAMGKETVKQRYEEAREIFVSFLERYRGGRLDSYNMRGIARSLCGLAAVANKQGMPSQAMTLLGAAKTIRMDYLHADRVLRDISEYLDIAKTARNLIGDKAKVRAALDEGSRMVDETTIDQVIAYAIRPNLETKPVTVDMHHTMGDVLCEYCGSPTKKTYRPQECWGKHVIVSTEKLASYKCTNCGLETLDAGAAVEFLKKATSIIENTDDQSTVKLLKQELLVIQS